MKASEAELLDTLDRQFSATRRFVWREILARIEKLEGRMGACQQQLVEALQTIFSRRCDGLGDDPVGKACSCQCTNPWVARASVESYGEVRRGEVRRRSYG